VNGQPRPPAESPRQQARLVPPPAIDHGSDHLAVAGDHAAASAASAESAEVFEEEVRAAVAYEKGLAAKALIALAFVALVIALRMLFLA
jgi:hypothetical protein